MGALILVFLAAAALIVVWYFIGKEFEFIAKEKGYASRKYFWWSFLLGPVGIPMVIALPDRRGGNGAGASSVSLPVDDDEIPEI